MIKQLNQVAQYLIEKYLLSPLTAKGVRTVSGYYINDVTTLNQQLQGTIKAIANQLNINIDNIYQRLNQWVQMIRSIEAPFNNHPYESSKVKLENLGNIDSPVAYLMSTYFTSTFKGRAKLCPRERYNGRLCSEIRGELYNTFYGNIQNFKQKYGNDIGMLAVLKHFATVALDYSTRAASVDGEKISSAVQLLSDAASVTIPMPTRPEN